MEEEGALELMQLQMLVAAVEEGGIGKGAERVLRSQPAVSMALRKLEEEIGVPLFDRSKRHRYSLTTAGELLYVYAIRLLHLRDEAIRALGELEKPQGGYNQEAHEKIDNGDSHCDINERYF